MVAEKEEGRLSRHDWKYMNMGRLNEVVSSMSKASEEAKHYFINLMERLREMDLDDKSEYLLQQHLDNIMAIMEEATKRHKEGGMSIEEGIATNYQLNEMINGIDVHTKGQLTEFLERTSKVN
jgi:hypothetical protein